LLAASELLRALDNAMFKMFVDALDHAGLATSILWCAPERALPTAGLGCTNFLFNLAALPDFCVEVLQNTTSSRTRLKTVPRIQALEAR
jgi:hypothetical protein